MNRKTRFIFSVILFFNNLLAFNQEFTPIVSQFEKKDYNASNQNWAVGQTRDGIMYFGNNKGLLEFDGTIWDINKLPENKLVRSLMVDKNDRIYVGSFEEFGYFEKDIYGCLKYTSLSELLQEYKMQNDEIWNILDFNGTIIFQSFTSYFTYDKKNVKGFRCPYTFLFFNLYNNKIYTHTNQSGFSLLKFQTTGIEPLINKELKSPVISVLTYDSKNALLVTKSDGLFLFNGKNIVRFETDADEELRKADVNRAIISKDSLILIGTILNGVTAISKDGKKRWTLNSSNVLQNNTVLGMYCDKDNNLWLCLDKGISLIKLNSSIYYIHSFSPSVGAIYSLSYQAPNLYIGTNQGLYSALYDNQKRVVTDVRLEPKIKGQVWNMAAIDGQHFCGNNEETFEIINRNANIIYPSVKGGMCIRKGIIHGQEVLVQGTYTDLCIYLKKNGKWQFSHSVENFVNPIRYLEIDYTGTIWASHLHQGLYAIRLTPDLRKIESINTYNSLDHKNKYNINVFSVNNRVVFTDHTGFYTFDDIEKKIIPHDELNKNLGNFSQAYRVCHFKSDMYWFICDGEAALVQITNQGIKLVDIVQYSLFRNQTVDDYQNIIPVSDDECFFTLENGLALYHYGGDLRKEKEDTRLQLKSVQTSDAELKDIIYLTLSNSLPPTTSYKRNNLVFTVFYPNYSQLNNLNFRYKMEGLDKVWSEPVGASQVTYNYMPYGKYNLQVEVLSKSGFKLDEISYRFEVRPPFYLSNMAKIVYVILFLLFIYGIYLYLKHIFWIKKEKIHSEQEEIRKKEIEKREQQIMALEKEKLESELTLKSKELAESTMTIIKKNEMLVNIKEEVMTQKNMLGSQYPNKYYERLIRLLDENLSSEDDWVIFRANFDRIHENFFRNLHVKYPELTSNDLRFCAYLRLNLSSKDIAHLMNISLKGVEVGRYRIRKKIGLPSSKSLTEFMIEFK
ncbi:MAG: triple tyrosine motif-containing protein [Paludibacter sp.]